MKHIEKRAPPDEFTRWVKKNPGANWEGFTKDAPKVKADLRLALLKEQRRLCCYCERRIDAKASTIEHLLPKGRFPHKMFDHGNLLASCNTKNSCNTKRGGWYSENMVSPLATDCETRLVQEPSGVLEAAPNDQGALDTIVELGLNSQDLVSRRRRVYRVISSMRDGMTPQEFQTEAERQLAPGKDSCLTEFWTTIKAAATQG
jgi:uncharacterized protein (TIGR02646 family)